MFENAVPRYEVLSRDAMDTLDWPQRSSTEQFMLRRCAELGD